MATASLGRLTLDLVAKVAGYTEPLSQAERKTQKSTQAITGYFNSVHKSGDTLKSTIADLALVAGTTAASFISLNKIIEIQRNFDKLNTSLVTATGSADGANIAFNELQDFAKKTPYGLEQSVIAFVKLVNMGLNPSQRALMSYGNTAAAMGKDLDQMIEAVADAATGEFERLKEFGIKASQQNGKVALTFQGSTKVIENSSEAIQEYLLKIGEVNFADAATTRMKTLDGAFMNFEDTLDSVVLKVSQSGIGDFLKDNLNMASDSLVMIGDNLELVGEGAILLSSVLAGKVASGLVLSAKATVIDIAASRQKVLVNYEVAKSELAATAAMVRAMGATNAETAALMANTRAAYQKAAAAKQASLTAGGLMTAGRGVLGVFGGPVGLAVTLASVATGFILMKDNAKESTSVIEEQSLSVDELRVKYEKMTSAQLKLKKVDAINEIEKQTERLNSFKSAIQQVIDELNAEGDIKQSSALQNYLNDLISGGEKAQKAFSLLEKQALVSEPNLRLMADLDNKINESTRSIEKQKQIKDLASKSTNALTEFQKKQNIVISEQARVLGLTTAEWAKLTKQQQDYASKVGEKSTRDIFVGTFTTKNGSREQAEFWADQYEAMGVGFTQKLSEAQKKIAIEAWNNSGNFVLKPDQIKSFSKVQGLAAQYNFSDKENNYGLPSGLLSAIMMNESRGDTYRNGKLLTSESGAQGSFQFMPDTAKRFNVDVKSVESSALGAAKYLQYLYSKFQDWNKAIAAYHAGEGNVERRTNIGPRTKGYVVNAQKYIAASNQKTSFDTSLMMPTQADILAQQVTAVQAAKDLADKRKDIDTQYYKGAEKLAEEHKDRVEKINLVYSGTKELKTRLAQETALYLDQTTKLKVQREEDYANLTAFETDRIKQLENYYSRQIELATTNTELNDKERAKEISALQRKRDFEINAVRREQQEQVQSAFEAYMNETEIVLQRYKREKEAIKENHELAKEYKDELLRAKDMDIANVLTKNTQSIDDIRLQNLDYIYRKKQPNQAAWTDLQNQYNDENGSLDKTYSKQRSGIFSAVDDENKRSALLLEAHEQYLEAKSTLDDKYAAMENDLKQTQVDNQLSAYNNVLSTASSVFSSMTSMAKDAYGEQSGAYKAMFLMQQTIAIGQATINAFLAYSNVLATAPYPINLTLAPLTLGLGMANVGLIAGQTIAGMAHSGIDNIPTEGTWLLDGGERVLNPKQNQDLTRYLDERRSQEIQTAQTTQPQNLQINNILDPSIVGDYMGTSSGTKTFMNFIKNNRSSIKAVIG